LTIRFGDIVLVEEVLDPQGRNPKDRFAVVLTPPDQLEEGGMVSLVAITGTIVDPPPDDFVELPWHRDRHPVTRLTKRSAAACRWIIRVDPSRILRRTGRVPTAQLAAIEATLKRLAGEEAPDS
jgi:mRNA-degrading endonuclease toxin of MazEF toxin-antitoxin module